MGARMELDSRQPAFCFRLPPAGFELHPPKIPLNQRHLSTWSCKPVQATAPGFQPSPTQPRPSETCPEASNSLAPFSLQPRAAPERIPSTQTTDHAIPTVSTSSSVPSPPKTTYRNKHHRRSSPSIIPRLPPNKLSTLPAGRTAYIPLQQPGTTAAACRIPLSSSLLTHPSCHPPSSILSTTLDRQPAS